MDEIELVVKIPKEEYEMIVNSEDCGLHTLTRAIAHGAILPKGHGRLIDADEFKNYCQTGLENVKPLFKTEKYCKLAIDITQGIIADVDEMETIIEADKEESMTYLEGLDKIMEAMKKRELDQNAQRTVYLGLITTQLVTIADELARMNGSVKSGVHCACTDEEISKSFMEDVSAVEEQLPKQTNDKIVHVGDEIYSELTNSKAVVQRIDVWERYQCFTDNGDQFIIDKHTFNDYWVKTGKNYPQIAEVLKQMNEVKE